MATKKQQSDFNKKVITYLMGIGAELVKVNEFRLNTTAGELKVILHDAEASQVYSVFCRFEDEKRAKETVPNLIRLNIYSGKYNFHEFDAGVLLNLLDSELSSIVINEIPIMQVKSNQYGFMPCKTYYYIVNRLGETYHYKDEKWRKKPLIQLWTYAYKTEKEANEALEELETLYHYEIQDAI